MYSLLIIDIFLTCDYCAVIHRRTVIWAQRNSQLQRLNQRQTCPVSTVFDLLCCQEERANIPIAQQSLIVHVQTGSHVQKCYLCHSKCCHAPYLQHGIKKVFYAPASSGCMLCKIVKLWLEQLREFQDRLSLLVARSSNCLLPADCTDGVMFGLQGHA